MRFIISVRVVRRPFIAVNVVRCRRRCSRVSCSVMRRGRSPAPRSDASAALELADSGTLFLDEIGDSTAGDTGEAVACYSRSGKSTRVGGTTPIKVNVRVVTATNQPLRQLVEEGRFRSDLCSSAQRAEHLSARRCVIGGRISAPGRRFVRQFSAQHDRPFHGISADAMQIMADYAGQGTFGSSRI